MLTAIGFPLCIVSFIAFVLLVITLFVTMHGRSESSIGTSDYVMYYNRTKPVILGLIAAALLWVVGFSLPSEPKPVVQQTTQTETAIPQYQEIYHKCFDSVDDQSKEHRLATMQKCQLFTVSQLANMKVAGQLVAKDQAVTVIYKIPKLVDLQQHCIELGQAGNNRYDSVTTQKLAMDNCETLAERQYDHMKNKYKEGAR